MTLGYDAFATWSKNLDEILDEIASIALRTSDHKYGPSGEWLKRIPPSSTELCLLLTSGRKLKPTVSCARPIYRRSQLTLASQGHASGRTGRHRRDSFRAAAPVEDNLKGGALTHVR